MRRTASVTLMALATISLVLGARLLDADAAGGGALAVTAGVVLAAGALVGAWRTPHAARDELGSQPD